MLSKYPLLALAALALLLAGSCYLLKRSYAANGAQKLQITVLSDQIKSAQEQRKLDQATLALRAIEKSAIARKTAFTRASYATAAASSPEWAQQPVPQEVQNALSQ